MTPLQPIIASFGKYFILPRFFAQFFAQMFPFGIFICIGDPVRSPDVFGGGSDITRHDVAISLALISLMIHRIFARHKYTRHMHIHQRKGLSGFSALIKSPTASVARVKNNEMPRLRIKERVVRRSRAQKRRTYSLDAGGNHVYYA